MFVNLIQIGKPKSNITKEELLNHAMISSDVNLKEFNVLRIQDLKYVMELSDSDIFLIEGQVIKLSPQEYSFLRLKTK